MVPVVAGALGSAPAGRNNLLVLEVIKEFAIEGLMVEMVVSDTDFDYIKTATGMIEGDPVDTACN